MRVQDIQKPPTWVRMAAHSGDNKPDPLDLCNVAIENCSKPLAEEIAMIHPFNSSSIKLRNNGIIDIWVNTDQGIRLDPQSKTINTITDGEKHHISYFRAWMHEDLEWWGKGSFLFDSEEADFTINAYTEISMNTDGLNAPIGMNATGDINLNSDRDINLNSDRDINLNSDRDVNIKTTGRDINLDSDRDVNIKAIGRDVNIRAAGKVVINGTVIELN